MNCGDFTTSRRREHANGSEYCTCQGVLARFWGPCWGSDNVLSESMDSRQLRVHRKEPRAFLLWAGSSLIDEVSEWNVVLWDFLLLGCRRFLCRGRLRHGVLAFSEHLHEARDDLGRVTLVAVAVRPFTGL